MKILHVIKDPHDQLAIETAKSHAATEDVSLLLVQDGVVGKMTLGVPVYACREDVESRGVTFHGEKVTYPEMVDLITGHDKVISW